MSLLSRLLGRDRPDPSQVTAAVTVAISSVPGVSATAGLSFEWRQYGSGDLSGLVDVDSAATWDAVLRAIVSALSATLGESAERVVVYVGGRGPDGAAYDGETVGLRTSPTGWDLAQHFS